MGEGQDCPCLSYNPWEGTPLPLDWDRNRAHMSSTTERVHVYGFSLLPSQTSSLTLGGRGEGVPCVG